LLVDELAAAILILDSVVNQHKSLEAHVMLASLRASHHPALMDKEYATDKEKGSKSVRTSEKGGHSPPLKCEWCTETQQSPDVAD